MKIGLRVATGGRSLLVAFLAPTFAWSWSCWLLAPRIEPVSAPVAEALTTLGGFGPSLAAVAVIAWTGGRRALLAWLARCLNWRIGAGPIAWAFLLPLLVLAPAIVVAAVRDGGLGSSPLVTHLPLAAANLVLILLLGGPLGEEFGWRGCAWPALRARHGWRASSLWLGGVWGLWHLPLFFMAGTLQGQLPFLPFLASTIVLSVVFGWLSERSRGSILPALMLHTAVNWWAWVTPGLLSGGNQQQITMALGMLALLGAGLLIWPAPRPGRHVATSGCKPGAQGPRRNG